MVEQFTWQSGDPFESVQTPFCNTNSGFVVFEKKQEIKEISQFVENKVCDNGDYHLEKEGPSEKEDEDNGSKSVELQAKKVYNYSKGNCLVNLVKKDAGKKSASGHDLYLCKLRDQTGNEKAEKLIAANELSCAILITMIQLSDGKDGNKISKLNASIYGKIIEELQPLLQATNSVGTMIYKGKVIDAEDTVLSLNMTNLSEVLILPNGRGSRI